MEGVQSNSHCSQKIRMTLTFATAFSICGGLVDFRVRLRVYHSNNLLLILWVYNVFLVWPMTPLCAASEVTECLKFDCTGAGADDMYKRTSIVLKIIVS